MQEADQARGDDVIGVAFGDHGDDQPDDEPLDTNDAGPDAPEWHDGWVPA